MTNPFTEHPAEVGEDYLGHMASASGFGVTMILGGLMVMVHAILPFLFVTAGSRTMDRLHRRMMKRVDKVNWERHPII